jgi:hypothetical protein
MAQAPPPEHQGGRNWVEQTHGWYGVYPSGHSRTVTIPASVEMTAGEYCQIWRGKYEGRTVYLRAIPLSAPQMDKSQPPVAGVTEQQIIYRGQSQWKVRKGSRDGELTLTIPAGCDEELFGREKEQMMISGWQDDEIGYLMTVPDRFWSGSNPTGAIELPRED